LRKRLGSVRLEKIGPERGLDVRVCEDDSRPTSVFDSKFCFPILASDTPWKSDEKSHMKLGEELIKYRWHGRDDHPAGF